MPSEADLTAEYIAALSTEFDTMCQQRHDMGAKKYGPVKFLEVNSLEMAAEEVIDLANYARYTYIKIRMLVDTLADLTSNSNTSVLGKDGFRSSL